MRKLPYRAQTQMGDTFDIEFPLHSDTGDAVRVGQLVSAVLNAISNDIALAGETSNGDVLQAVAMTMAIRSRMIHAPDETTQMLCRQLLDTALTAAAASPRCAPRSGHA